jgi:hypothetical protein
MNTYKSTSLRSVYGKDCYITEIDDNIIIPWRLLTIGEYHYYFQQINPPLQYPFAFYEDEIFTLCVLEKSWTTQKDYLAAGIVSSVAGNIWEYSIPHSQEEIEYFLQSLINQKLCA